MNALAGGGTFATMPSLIALGLPSTIANATSNVALQGGAMMSAWGYRRDLAARGGLSVRAIATITFLAGAAGSLLLIATPTRLFDVVIPWLLLAAFVALAFGPAVTRRMEGRTVERPATLGVVQAFLGVYGGYFGGGFGLMMAAAWGLVTGEPVHRLAALRTAMLATANAAAAIVFVVGGMVDWRLMLPMLLGALAGGYGGAKVGQRLPPGAIRAITLAVTGVMTVVFFERAYG